MDNPGRGNPGVDTQDEHTSESGQWDHYTSRVISSHAEGAGQSLYGLPRESATATVGYLCAIGEFGAPRPSGGALVVGGRFVPERSGGRIGSHRIEQGEHVVAGLGVQAAEGAEEAVGVADGLAFRRDADDAVGERGRWYLHLGAWPKPGPNRISARAVQS